MRLADVETDHGPRQGYRGGRDGTAALSAKAKVERGKRHPPFAVGANPAREDVQKKLNLVGPCTPEYGVVKRCE